MSIINILVVDDNSNTRLVIKLLLEEYQSDKDMTFNIIEAENGQEAIDKATKEEFDIIFMDIEMPIIEGIEATKIIKEKVESVMIIAVSAMENTDSVKMILNNGAEDYISKPINSDIFSNRLKSYISINKFRKQKSRNIHKINVYTSNVYNRFTKFLINSENTLAEFWECFLLNTGEKYDTENDVIRTVFLIAEAQYYKNQYSEIYLEESEEFQFFSILNIDNIPLDIVELIVGKSNVNIKYKIEEDTITIKLHKILTKQEELNETSQGTEYESESNISHETIDTKEAKKDNTMAYKKSQSKLEVFDYIDQDDLIDLKEYSSSLNSLMLLAGSGDLEYEDIQEMYTSLERIGSLLSSYSEVYLISTSLSSLSSTMQTHQDVFKENSKDLGPICKAFANDMSTWIDMSFETGAPSVDFMNDTIAVNCQTISSMLTINEDSQDDEEELDDIFDF